jgi:hypothetical protein
MVDRVERVTDDAKAVALRLMREEEFCAAYPDVIAPLMLPAISQATDTRARYTI